MAISHSLSRMLNATNVLFLAASHLFNTVHCLNSFTGFILPHHQRRRHHHFPIYFEQYGCNMNRFGGTLRSTIYDSIRQNRISKTHKRSVSFTRIHSNNAPNQNPPFPSDDDCSYGEIKFEKRSFGNWRTIDWKGIANDFNYSQSEIRGSAIADIDQLIPTASPDCSSPIEKCIIRDRIVYIKRDDLIHLTDSNVSGNKARKMLALNEIPVEDFPDSIVSYGGPQSNAMLALAAIVNSKNVQKEDANQIPDEEMSTDSSSVSNDVIGEKGKGKKRFLYYTKKLPRYLRKQPNGNLLRSLSLGMELVELSHEKYQHLFGGYDGGSPSPPPELEPPCPGNSVWVPQGGACGVALTGSKLLAIEIVSFWSKQSKGMPLSVCLPGGTCTTALMLSREIDRIIEQSNSDGTGNEMDIKVVVIPCIGDNTYANRQMSSLNSHLGGKNRRLPAILKPFDNSKKRSGKNGYFRFGEPDPAILKTFLEMSNEYGIYCDLLYGAPSWCLLFDQWTSSDVRSPLFGRQVMYVHSGGLEGVSSQMTRYKHKGLVNSNEVQI